MTRPAVALLLILLAAPFAPAQGPDAAEFVRGLYQRYANLDPNAAVVDAWVREMRKGMSPGEVHAQILGSQATLDAAGRRDDQWIRVLYAGVLGREGEREGVRNWVERVRVNKGDRVAVAREFLVAAAAEIQANANRPVVIAPADLPAHLKSATQVLAQTVAAEFPGPDHFLLRNQAEVLAKYVSNSQRVLTERDRYPTQFADTIKATAATIAAVEQGVAHSRLPARGSRQLITQCNELLVAIAQGGNIQPQPPPGVPMGGAGRLSPQEAREYRKLLDAFAADLASTDVIFRQTLLRGWATTQLLNRVADLSAETDRLRLDVRGGIRRDDFANRAGAMNATANEIGRALGEGKADVRAVQAWYSAGTSLRAVTDGLGVAPPPGGGRVPDAAFRAIDAASAECDGLIVSFTPYTTYNRTVARLVADLQDLKNRYATLRRVSAVPGIAKRDLDSHLEAIGDRMKTVSADWREATRDRRLADAPDLNDLLAADRDVTKFISDVK